MMCVPILSFQRECPKTNQEIIQFSSDKCLGHSWGCMVQLAPRDGSGNGRHRLPRQIRTLLLCFQTWLSKGAYVICWWWQWWWLPLRILCKTTRFEVAVQYCSKMCVQLWSFQRVSVTNCVLTPINFCKMFCYVLDTPWGCTVQLMPRGGSGNGRHCLPRQIRRLLVCFQTWLSKGAYVICLVVFNKSVLNP